jgi:hypothetical protein
VSADERTLDAQAEERTQSAQPAAEHVLPLAVLNRRFPSKRDISSAYLAGLFPLQAWALYNALPEVPAWSLQMGVWDVIGVTSYIQAFVVVEGVAVILPLLVLSALLPARWLRDRFISSAAVVIYVSAGWFVLAHFHDFTVRYWSFGQFLPWLAAFALSLLLALYAVRQSRVESLVLRFIDRIVIVSALYLCLGVVALAIVLGRNV